MTEKVFERWKAGLRRTRKVTFGRIATLFGATEITDDTWDELEAILIQADLGVETSNTVIEALQTKVNQEGLTKTAELQNCLHEELLSRLDEPPKISLNEDGPTVILIVGVNGSGKTTTIAKLGSLFLSQGKTVILGAADTFRAAAMDQLKVWGERLDISVISGQPNSDPGAVAYDTVQSALARKVDIVMIDTAGRLHTRHNLMEELKKVYRVAGKALPGAPHETWLVLDATTGQNALIQARAFHEAVDITGIILAKLDSSARGGMAFAVQRDLGLPILFAGLGETTNDLQPFDRKIFVDSIMSTN
jgi:fused signal recognition particle receptor